MNRQERIGQRIRNYSFLLFLAALVICFFDVLTMGARGEMLVPLSGYLAMIFGGVVMQVVGNAIPNMRFRHDQTKPGIK